MIRKTIAILFFLMLMTNIAIAEPVIIVMKKQPSFLPGLSIQRLQIDATESQTGIKNVLISAGATDIKSNWLSNSISADVSPDAINYIAQRKDVAAIQPDRDVELFEIEQSVNQISAPLVWDMGITGKGVNVAIIDSGIAPHPDLQNRIVKWKDVINNQPNPYDDNGHGTHVAGIVAGNGKSGSATGIAPEANLFGIKVMNAIGQGKESDMMYAIQWAVEQKADIISMSIGIKPSEDTFMLPNCDDKSPALKYTISNAVDMGVIVVAAAGNDGRLVASPGCISDVIVVGSVDSNDSISTFSGRGGAMIDHGVTAPGYKINSLSINSGYTVKSGTSMATPAVSGLVALLLQKNPNLTPKQVKNILFSNSIDYFDAGPDYLYGNGRIDAYKAVKAIDNPIKYSVPGFEFIFAIALLLIAFKVRNYAK